MCHFGVLVVVMWDKDIKKRRNLAFKYGNFKLLYLYLWASGTKKQKIIN